MGNVLQDLRYAARILRRSPGFTTVAVLALALGIGASTAVFAVVNGVLLRPLPFPESDRLYAVSYAPQNGPFGPGQGVTDSHFLELERHNGIFESITAHSRRDFTLTGAGEPARLAGSPVTADFLRVLRVRPSIGRGFHADDTQPGRDKVVLLGDRVWRSRFSADPRMVGKSITLDGLPYTVIGVMPEGFNYPGKVDLWTPLSIRLDPHNSFSYAVFGRLRPGLTPEQA